mgnify:CR=1 FL=1
MPAPPPDPPRQPPQLRGWIRCTDDDDIAVWVPVHNIACMRAAAGGTCISLIGLSDASDEDADLYVSQRPDEVAFLIAKSLMLPPLSAVAA